jgi:hypothetical protein
MRTSGSRARRRLAICLAAVALGALGPLAAPAAAGTSARDAHEAQLARVIAGDHNAARAAAGLAPLAVLPALARTAEAHNDWMVASGRFQHSNLEPLLHPTVPGTSWAAENLYRGMGSAGAAVGAWLNSPSHRTNVLSPRATHLYVAVHCDAQGRLWSTVQFAGNDRAARSDVPTARPESERRLTCNDRTAPWHPFATPEAFVTQQYRDFLFREPEPTGLAYWSDQLRRGRLDRTGVVHWFLHSPEFDARITSAARVYQLVHGRAPTSGELQSWNDQRSGGASTEQAALPLLAVLDQSRGPVDDAGFVTLLFQQGLGRNPSSAELAHWTAVLAGGSPRTAAMIGVSGLPEFARRHASDLRVLMAYQGLLGRDAEPEGAAYWTRMVRSGLSVHGLIDGFLTSPEYAQRVSR